MKVFNYSELHFSELTSFKIHTLAGKLPVEQHFPYWQNVNVLLPSFADCECLEHSEVIRNAILSLPEKENYIPCFFSKFKPKQMGLKKVLLTNEFEKMRRFVAS